MDIPISCETVFKLKRALVLPEVVALPIIVRQGVVNRDGRSNPANSYDSLVVNDITFLLHCGFIPYEKQSS